MTKKYQKYGILEKVKLCKGLKYYYYRSVIVIIDSHYIKTVTLCWKLVVKKSVQKVICKIFKD